MNLAGTYGDTVLAKHLPRCDLISDGDLEHAARRCPQLVTDKVSTAELLDETVALAVKL